MILAPAGSEHLRSEMHSAGTPWARRQGCAGGRREAVATEEHQIRIALSRPRAKPVFRAVETARSSIRHRRSAVLQQCERIHKAWLSSHRPGTNLFCRLASYGFLQCQNDCCDTLSPG